MRLDAPVSTIMIAGPETVGPLTPLSAVREILFRLHAHHVPVVAGRKLIGIVSSNDLLRAGPPGRFAAVGRVDAVLEGIPTREVMTPDPVVLTPTDTIRRAAELLRTGSFGSLPIVDDDGELLGIVTVADVLGHVLEEQRQ
jgi:CBS domain-containing protein